MTALRHLKPQATPLQWVVLVLLCATEIAGIVAIQLGHRDLGRTLIPLGIIVGAPFNVWVRRTRERAPLADQHRA